MWRNQTEQMYHTTQQITHAQARIWVEQEFYIPCWLNGAHSTAMLKIKVKISGHTIDLVSVTPINGYRRENFADILNDIREFFHIGYGNSFYKEAIGLFTNEI